jgi:hypothetical protein
MEARNAPKLDYETPPQLSSVGRADARFYAGMTFVVALPVVAVATQFLDDGTPWEVIGVVVTFTLPFVAAILCHHLVVRHYLRKGNITYGMSDSASLHNKRGQNE